MKLEEASLNPPKGLEKFLLDLGEGENGFGGTPFSNGELSLLDYLQGCIDKTDEANLKPGRVPQTIFWLLNTDNQVVGMVKVRHCLAESTRINGGHIGFFIHPSQRGHGYGKKALALALAELKEFGEEKALLTVYSENAPSIKVVEFNGGQFADRILDPKTNHEINRYWIELDP